MYIVVEVTKYHLKHFVQSEWSFQKVVKCITPTTNHLYYLLTMDMHSFFFSFCIFLRWLCRDTAMPWQAFLELCTLTSWDCHQPRLEESCL